MKVVINACFGGFGLSDACVIEYAKRKNIKIWIEPALLDGKPNKLLGNHFWTVPPQERLHEVTGAEWAAMTMEQRQAYNEAYSKTQIYPRDIPRDDPTLVAIVEDLGAAICSGMCAKLKVVEIPDDVVWEISEYDGLEHVAEKHRRWS